MTKPRRRDADRWFVYHLVDPRDGAPFYVGMSADPAERLKEHCKDRASDAYDRCWDIRQAGMEVVVLVIAGFWGKFDALDFEHEQTMSLHGLVNFSAHPRPCVCPRHHAIRLRKIEKAKAEGYPPPWAWYEFLDLRERGLLP